jgi:hypothetical protein
MCNPDPIFFIPYPGSRIKKALDPGSRLKKALDPGSRLKKAPNPVFHNIKNLSYLTQKLLLSSRKYDP